MVTTEPEEAMALGPLLARLRHHCARFAVERPILGAMREAEIEAGVAAYLVGHGTYRSPHLIELQWMRIRRYRDLLGTKYETHWKQLEAFVDVNFPRADRVNEQAFPSYFRLLQAVGDGQVKLVYIDIEMEIGTSQYYHWVAASLEKAGARVVNVFYDSDRAMREALSLSYKGQANPNEVDHASDFVAFFPALSSEIIRAALRNVLHLPGCQKTDSDELWNRLSDLGGRNPYAAGRLPFIQEELEREWSRLRHKVIESELSERRKHETLFKLSPVGVGLLIDEYPSSESDARTNDELLWAERRIQAELRFDKTASGNTISYSREVDGYRVFADIRGKGRITFYAYKLPRDAKKQTLSFCSFHLQDRSSRELPEKWNRAFAAATQTAP
jgi:hypothetical protein